MPILLSLTSPSLQMYQKVDQDKKKAEIDAMKIALNEKHGTAME